MVPYENVGNFAVKYSDSEILIVYRLSDSSLIAIAEITRRIKGNLLKPIKMADVDFLGSRRLGMFFENTIPIEEVRKLLA